MDDLRARITTALNGHTEHSRDCHLSGKYLTEQIWPIIEAALARPAASEAEALRKGIQDYLDGNYGPPRGTSKLDKCPHGHFLYEPCEACIDRHFADLLLRVALSTSRPAQAEDGWDTDMENAPKDGSDVLFPIELVGRAYWCTDLKRWVLAYPLHMEYVSHPTKFRLPSWPRDAKVNPIKNAVEESR